MVSGLMYSSYLNPGLVHESHLSEMNNLLLEQDSKSQTMPWIEYPRRTHLFRSYCTECLLSCLSMFGLRCFVSLCDAIVVPDWLAKACVMSVD